MTRPRTLDTPPGAPTEGYELAFTQGVWGSLARRRNSTASVHAPASSSLPRRAWAFSASPGSIIGFYLESEPRWSVPAIHRELALHMDRAYEEDRRRLKALIWAFRVTSVLLVLEVVAWVLNLLEVT